MYIFRELQGNENKIFIHYFSLLLSNELFNVISIVMYLDSQLWRHISFLAYCGNESRTKNRAGFSQQYGHYHRKFNLFRKLNVNENNIFIYYCSLVLSNAVNIAVYFDSQLLAKLATLVFVMGHHHLESSFWNLSYFDQQWAKQLNRTEHYFYLPKL